MARKTEFSVEAMMLLAGAIAGICVWSYSTFSTKEQTQQLIMMVETNKKEASAQIAIIATAMSEQKKDFESFSDRNRQRMEAITTDIREEIKLLREDIRTLAKEKRR